MVLMEFRDAARVLGRQITSAEMAKVLGVSDYTIRQARLEPGKTATGYRRPPAGWEAVVVRLARERARELERLADELEGGT